MEAEEIIGQLLNQASCHTKSNTKFSFAALLCRYERFTTSLNIKPFPKISGKHHTYVFVSLDLNKLPEWGRFRTVRPVLDVRVSHEHTFTLLYTSHLNLTTSADSDARETDASGRIPWNSSYLTKSPFQAIDEVLLKTRSYITLVTLSPNSNPNNYPIEQNRSIHIFMSVW